MALSSSKLQALFSKAVKKHTSKKYPEATLIYKKILKDNPNHVDANCMLGTLFAEIGETDSGLKFLLNADKLSTDTYLTKNNLGNVYKMIGEYEKAASYYQQAIHLAPDNIQAYNNLAIIFKRQSQLAPAIELYQKALSLNPQFLEAHYNLGKLYSDKDDNVNAYACFQRVVDINPQYAPVHNLLGDYYRTQQQPEKANQHYHRCLDLLETDLYGVQLKLAHFEKGELPARSPDKLIMESYESKASNWDQDVNRATMEFLGPQIIQSELDRLYPDTNRPNDLNIIDLGCGTGLCGEYLQPLASCLDGVDLSPHMLKIATAKKLYDNLHCKEILDFLQENDSSYDLITASGVIIFFGQLEKLHQLISDQLRQNGIFIYTTYVSKESDIDIRSNLHFSHSEKYLRKCAEQASLKIEMLQEVIHEYDYGEAQKGFIVTLRKL